MSSRELLATSRLLPEGAGDDLPPPLESLPAAYDLQGVTPYETHLLLEYLEQAHAYVRELGGHADVRRARYGAGFGGVLGIFLMDVRKKSERTWRWVVVGNPPASHFPLADAASPRAALVRYCEIADQWLDTIRRGDSVEGIPLRAAPTAVVAHDLASKLQTLRRLVLPALR